MPADTSPLPVPAVSTSSVHATTWGLAWTYDDARATGFSVTLAEGDGAFQEVAQVDAKERSYTIEHLLPLVTYKVRIKALGADQPSGYSEVLTAALLEPLPADAGLVVNIQDYGATGDGATNDRAAFVSAFAALTTAGGGTLIVPPGNYVVRATDADVFLQVPGQITIRGEPGQSVLTLQSDRTDGAYRELLRITGDHVTLAGLVLTRTTANVSGILLKIFPSTALELQAVTIDGQNKTFGNGLHAMEVSSVANGVYRDIHVTGCVVRGVDFGLFQTNAAVTTLTGLVIEDSLFERNFADDLELNAPSATWSDVTIRNNVFRNSASQAVGAGFGVGLAHVSSANILGNRFSHYQYEPIHIEDRSTDILIRDNVIESGYTEQTDWSSSIFIINDSKNILITDNVFDLRANTNHLSALYVGPGGVNLPFPQNVTLQNNVIHLGAADHTVAVTFDAPTITVVNNQTD